MMEFHLSSLLECRSHFAFIDVEFSKVVNSLRRPNAKNKEFNKFEKETMHIKIRTQHQVKHSYKANLHFSPKERQQILPSRK